MAISKAEGDRRRTALGGRRAAEDGGGDFLASRGMSFSSGEESRSGAVAAQAIEA
jgi:hypothetical protein